MLKIVKWFGKLKNIIFLYKKFQKHTTLEIYATPEVVASDEIDRLKKLIFLFSCHRKASGESSSILREKLILLLALYLKFGYSKETKERASKILKVKKPAINSMNLELRQNNYLIKDTMNTRRGHLHPDLDILQQYVESRGDNQLMFLFRIKHET